MEDEGGTYLTQWNDVKGDILEFNSPVTGDYSIGIGSQELWVGASGIFPAKGAVPEAPRVGSSRGTRCGTVILPSGLTQDLKPSLGNQIQA